MRGGVQTTVVCCARKAEDGSKKNTGISWLRGLREWSTATAVGNDENKVTVALMITELRNGDCI